jgi:3-phenylpropionate/trans-cinnamate dioxygenase ferredoxin subunit
VSFVKACGLSDLKPEVALRVEIDGLPVAVVRADDEIFAIRDECSHDNVALSDGEVDGATIECWLHGSVFDLRNGKPMCLPANTPVPVYAVRIDGGDILVDTTAKPHGPVTTTTATSQESNPR